MRQQAHRTRLHIFLQVTFVLFSACSVLEFCPSTAATPQRKQNTTSRSKPDRRNASPPNKKPWWQHAVFYEIYPRSFKDSDGDGIGDLNGITSKLDYLAGLGIDAIWITPFYPSPQIDFGYDVSDYENIDPQFGTLADFDRLVAEAHKRRIKVIVDFVLNHTSDQHPFFVAARASRTSPYRDWYIWRDPKPDGSPPNNWSSSFGPVAWTLDAKTNQYYYHRFYSQQPELNWNNPAVEKRMFETVRFWMKRGVDGFRLDAVNFLFEDSQFRDNPVLPELRPGSTTEYQQELKYNRDLPEIHDVLLRLRSFTDAYDPNRILIGEAYVPQTAELMKYYGPANNELQLPFNFFLVMGKVRTNLDASIFRSVINESEKALQGRPTTYVLSNHDIPRAFDRYGDGKNNDQIAKLFATLLLTLRGSPFIYYGEEIGMVTTEPKTIEEVRDPVGKRYFPANKGRDGERTPMQWDASAGAGFTSGQPWLKIPPSARRHNVAIADKDSSSILNFYKRLIRLRRNSPGLLDGDYRSIGDDPHILLYRRRTPKHTMLVALNMSNQSRSVRLDADTTKSSNRLRVVLSNQPTSERKLIENDVRLAPFEAVIIEGDTDQDTD
ncbi:MAG: alpha-glucosidase [Pyrinomonadaceae bacterium MAG19_C2-C3]|nr:alpha-glucosidase [Pyrinomonadaceae bacterium MAG19_C2-C3]